ncbi:30S ribosomal protein S19 [Candidatus Parcubacteria bacterium]|nr:30S ribosomal protein S19 [Patescibacteria group bacterium]MBU4381148.1 30S ribosomal protein S19 [Patescibacteria group bacterium]MCG2689129.1 30S ribosomal protein S19 [Candidatus Parcubacteria bacterium]
MSRSQKKGPYIDPKLQEKVKKAKATLNRGAIKTWSRRSTISPEMVGLNFEVHNGKTFIGVFVTESMVGHKLGEFSLTRTFRTHSRKGLKKESSAKRAPEGISPTAPKPSPKAGAK